MEIKQEIIDRIKLQLEAMTRANDAQTERVNSVEALLSLVETNQQPTISCPTQGISTPSSLNDEEPLRSQLMYEGKPIPASGTAATDIVKRARAFAREQKSSTVEITDSE